MTTLFGQKRDPNEPRKPMKRSGMQRKSYSKSAEARTPSVASRDKALADRLFMRQFKGLPSIVSGRTCSSILKDEKGVPLPTEAHHILPKSIYPEYRHTKENIAVLTREEHCQAHENPNKFMEWIKENRPEVFEWVKNHEHHRGEL